MKKMIKRITEFIKCALCAHHNLDLVEWTNCNMGKDVKVYYKCEQCEKVIGITLTDYEGRNWRTVMGNWKYTMEP